MGSFLRPAGLISALPAIVLAQFAARVRAVREVWGWRQEDLAAQAGLRLSHISEIESGNVTLSIEALADLAQALGQSLHTLFGQVSLGRVDLLGLGGRLQRLRERRHWSVDRLSQACGVSEGHLQGVERGRNLLSLQSLVSVALALDCNPAALIEHRLG